MRFFIMNQIKLLLVSVSVSLLLPHIVTAQACASGDLRIEQGNETAERIEGFVQYCWNGVWSTVCAMDPGRWVSSETSVACRQLGYQGDVSQRGSGCRSTTSSPFVTLNCPNNEVSNLQECEVMEVEGCDCTVGTNSYATVTCLKSCSTGEIRLEGGPTNREGRVEVCRNGRWGTVSTSFFSAVAEAVCNNFSLIFDSFKSNLGTQYGYRQSKPVYHCDVHGGKLNCRDGDNNSHHSDLGVACRPISKAVTTTSPPTTHPATSNPSPGGTTTVKANIYSTGEVLIVQACSNGEIRLEDGPNNIETEGRVEVCINGRWGTVQTSNNVNAVAKAVCSNFSLKLESFTNCLDTQCSYNQSKPVYRCDVSDDGTLTCRDGNNTNRDSDLLVACGPTSEVKTTIPPTTHPPTSDPSPGRITTVEALGAVTGVLMVLWLTTLTVLIGTCVVLRRECKQRVKSAKHNKVDLTYEEIPGPTSSTGPNTSTGHRPITNIADNPAYEAVKRDQAQREQC